MHHLNPIRRYAIRVTALGLAALLVPQTFPFASAQQEPAPQQASPLPPAVGSQQTAPQQQTAPVSPALQVIAADRPQDTTLASSDGLPSAPVPQSQESQAPPQQQQAPQQPPPLPQQPVGTAAAPAEKPTGIPGSRPSGAAIAPAKQKRVRALVISLGIVLAAGAAVGAVAGLSRASHSTP